jgi:archaellum component FlaF (FlaF/FlaG flagellin family)
MMSDILQNQIIAIEKGAKNKAKSLITEVYKTFDKPALYAGKTKKFEKVNDDAPDLPGESVKVQLIAAKEIEKVVESLADYFDVTATKDHGNCLAKADVVVDGTVLIEQAPVTYLLFLEKELQDISTFVGKIPTLDSSYEWNTDTNSGIYKSNPVTTQRTAKEQKPIVLYDATPEHPAQTQLITRDVLVGHWNTVELSGAIPMVVKEKLLKKVEKLLRAVKSAREKGNSTSVSKVEVGRKLLDFVFGDL